MTPTPKKKTSPPTGDGAVRGLGPTTVKTREQENIIVPKFPTIVQMSQYSVALVTSLVSASSL